MVHEIMHALGLMGHPHHVHTSILSYQNYIPYVLDNVPLVDMAVLYDMNGWGGWSGKIKTVFGTVDGLQFGVHDLEYGLSGSALIPWVDSGYTPYPREASLMGTASWSGVLVGKLTESQKDVLGVTELDVDFSDNSGTAEFHTIRYWNSADMWNSSGWSYDLYVNGSYFDSDDKDGIPDVVGAFYGSRAQVAAGTLQRPEIAAAFGAEKDD